MCLQSAVSLEIVDASCPHRSGGAVPPVPGFPPSSDNGDEEPVSHPLLPLMAGQTNWQRLDSPAVPAPNTSRALRAAPARRSGAIAEVEHATRGLLKLALGGTAVGAGLNAPAEIAEQVAAEIAAMTGTSFLTAQNAALANGVSVELYDRVVKPLALTQGGTAEIPAGKP